LGQTAEQYFQLVTLPLFGAISGGLISTAFAIFVDHPPTEHDSKSNLAWLLILVALAVIVVGPLGVHALLANPKSLDIGHRIDRIKAGDWAGGSKDDVIEAIKEQRTTIEKKLNSKGKSFRVALIFASAAAVAWPILYYVNGGISSGVIQILGIAAIILCAPAVRYWRRAALRRALENLKSYRAEAVKLPRQPPYRRNSRWTRRRVQSRRPAKPRV
jgi:hypothetical protein